MRKMAKKANPPLSSKRTSGWLSAQFKKGDAIESGRKYWKKSLAVKSLKDTNMANQSNFDLI
jgi:hypothetical protein